MGYCRRQINGNQVNSKRNMPNNLMNNTYRQNQPTQPYHPQMINMLANNQASDASKGAHLALPPPLQAGPVQQPLVFPLVDHRSMHHLNSKSVNTSDKIAQITAAVASVLNNSTQ